MMNSMIGAARNLNWRRLYAMATSGTGMVASTVIIMNLIRLGSTLVLTRLLDAEAYGVIGIVTTVGVVFGLITDLGFVVFVIRSKDGIDRDFLDEIWTLRLIRSIVLTIVVAIASGPITGYMNKPDLQLVIAISALGFLVEGLSSMGFATAIREGKIARVSIFDLICSVSIVVMTILFAVALRNYWAIVASNLAGGVLKIVLSYMMFEDSRRRWRFNLQRAKELGRFSRYIIGSSMISLILGQADKILLSKFMSLDVLGLYMIASTLSQVPAGFTASYVERIFFPNFSRFVREDSDNLSFHYYNDRWVISCLYLFGGGIFVATAPLIIEILYDPRYRGSAIFLQLLTVSTVLFLNNSAANHALIAVNRMWTTMTVNIVRLIWLLTMGVSGYAAYGVVGLVAAVGSVEIAAQIYSWWALHKAQLLNIRKEFMMIIIIVIGIFFGKIIDISAFALLVM